MSPFEPTFEDLTRAMALAAFDAAAAQRSLAPLERGPPPPGSEARPPRRAAALCYVFAGGDGRLAFPLTRRHAALREQPGQVALPGGRLDDGETSEDAAWREAREEVGLLRAPGAVSLGSLAEVYIPVTHTRLVVHVAVGPTPIALEPAPDEVEEIASVALAELVDPRRRETRRIVMRGVERDVPHLLLGPFAVWGATAMALAELGARLRAARDATP